MNQIIIDVTGLDTVIGDTVVLFGADQHACGVSPRDLSYLSGEPFH